MCVFESIRFHSVFIGFRQPGRPVNRFSNRPSLSFLGVCLAGGLTIPRTPADFPRNPGSVIQQLLASRAPSLQNSAVPIHKRPFCPTFALCAKNNPRRINQIPAVIFFASLKCLEYCLQTLCRKTSNPLFLCVPSRSWWLKIIFSLLSAAFRGPCAKFCRLM